jgi:AraC-like DNA-binding protein
MFYREYPPPPALKDHIQCFWALEHDYRDSFHSHEHLWADTQIELIFSYGEPYYRQTGGARFGLPKDFIIGPFKKELLLYSDGLTGFVAVRFHPWGFARFSMVEMKELINKILPAGDVLGGLPSLPDRPATGEVAQHRDMLGSWFARQPDRRPGTGGQSPVAEVANAIKARNGIVKISDLTAGFGLNPRRLERLFISETGMSAKMFARILRFNHAKRLIEDNPDIPLASLTYETGFADQAHFSHNFREMFGYTPAQFKSLIRQWKKEMAGERPDVVFLQDNP